MPSVDEVAERIAAVGRARYSSLTRASCWISSGRRIGACSNYAARASELLSLASNAPPACIVIVSSIVPHEWNTNVPEA